MSAQANPSGSSSGFSQDDLLSAKAGDNAAQIQQLKDLISQYQQRDQQYQSQLDQAVQQLNQENSQISGLSATVVRASAARGHHDHPGRESPHPARVGRRPARSSFEERVSEMKPLKNSHPCLDRLSECGWICWGLGLSGPCRQTRAADDRLASRNATQPAAHPRAAATLGRLCQQSSIAALDASDSVGAGLSAAADVGVLMEYHSFRAMNTDMLLAAEGSERSTRAAFAAARSFIEASERPSHPIL